MSILAGSVLRAEVENQVLARLMPTQGSTVQGTITFTQTAQGVRVQGTIEEVSPGKHGFHIHETGDCSAPDATSAGSHFNPHRMLHASPLDSNRHMGDLGNIVANKEGQAEIDYVDSQLSLEGEHTIVGRSVIVHAQEDDFATQPTGNAGARVACGVIEKVVE